MADYDLGTARGKIELDSTGAEKGALRAEGAINKLTARNEAVGRTLTKTGVAMAGIGALAVAGFGVAVNAAANFEKRISAISAVSGAAGSELDAVRKKALKLGADTVFSAGEAASAIEELVKAGLSVSDVLNGAADATVNLAAAGEIDLKSAATIASNAMNQFKLSAEDMPKIADLIAGAANASAIDVGDFGLALSQAGAVANVTGLEFGDLATAIGLMGNAGIRGSDAGTSLKTFLQNLIPVTDREKKLMKELGIITEDGGNKFFDAAGKIKPMAQVAGVLQDALKGMTKEQQLATLQTIFGSDAVRSAAIIADNGAAGFEKFAAAMGKVTAAEVAAKRMDNLSGSIEQLKGSIETVLIQAGSPFQDVLRGIVDGATKLVNAFGALSPKTQKLIVQIVLAVAAFLLLAGGFIAAVGLAFKFVVAIQRLRSAFKIIKEIKLVASAMRLLNLSFLANPVVLISLAIIALGVALFLAYKKFKPFRDAVDSLGRAIMTAVRFIKKNWDLLLPILLGPIGVIILVWRRFGTQIKTIIGAAITAVINFFTSLPGRVVGAVLAMVTAVIGFIAKLPAYIGFAIGFMIGLWLRFLIFMTTEVPVKIGQMVLAIIGFLAGLPSRIASILAAVIVAVVGWVISMLGKAVDLGARFLNAIGDFFGRLPGRIGGFLTQVLPAVVSWGADMASKAIKAGADFFKGLVDKIKGLPKTVEGILGKVIDAIKSVIKKGFNAVRDFGAGLWNGFKKGIGLASPSYIEKAMFAMTDNVSKSTGLLRKQIKTVQGLSTGIPTDFRTNLTVARGSGAVSSATPTPAAVATVVPTKDEGVYELTAPIVLKVGEDTLTTVVAKGFVKRKRSRT